MFGRRQNLQEVAISETPKSLPADLVIRTAIACDAEAIARFANALGRETGGDGTAMTADEVRRTFIEDDKDLHVLVAQLAETPVGYALHSVAYETAFAAKGRYLSDLYVSPSARGRGIARALMARLARLTRDEGGSFLWWIAKPGMPDGLPLYAKVADASDAVTAFASTGDNFEALVEHDKPGR